MAAHHAHPLGTWESMAVLLELEAGRERGETVRSRGRERQLEGERGETVRKRERDS